MVGVEPSAPIAAATVSVWKDGMADLEIGIVANPFQWQHWETAHDMLMPAVDLGDQDWIEICTEIETGKAHLGAVMSEGGDLLAAMILRTVKGKGGDLIEVAYIAGTDYHLWTAKLTRMLADGARNAGCVGLRAYGRPGWKKVLTDCGWKAPYVGYEMVV